jgi:hypothetical protein
VDFYKNLDSGELELNFEVLDDFHDGKATEVYYGCNPWLKNYTLPQHGVAARTWDAFTAESLTSCWMNDSSARTSCWTFTVSCLAHAHFRTLMPIGKYLCRPSQLCRLSQMYWCKSKKLSWSNLSGAA